jgi:F-type H+-transporting ATPase subunit alpha
VVEVLKQPQFSPVPVEEQVIVIYAVTEGHMDDIPISDVRRFEDGLREFFRTRQPGLLTEIRDTGKLPGEAIVEAGIAEFKETFEGSRTEE